MAASIPTKFICPISQDIMKDPINVCLNSHVFDRENIEAWTRTSTTCPECRERLGSFRSERGLRDEIQAFLVEHPEHRPAPVSTPEGTPPFIDGAVTIKATTINDEINTIIHVVAETTASTKQGACYIIGLDRSGSMADLVDPKNKEIPYTRMDLAKHLILCLAASLSPNDSLAVVEFASTASIVLPPTPMNNMGRFLLKGKLATITPTTSTNIHDCIDKMMSIANQPSLTGRAIFGALLTDGAETVVMAARGTVYAVSGRRMINPWILSTFGFGYDIQSHLLDKLAKMESSGGGSFGFIPDITFLGTVLINWLANCRVIGTRNTTLYYSINGASRVPFHTGPLAIGQPRDYLIKIPKGASLELFGSGPIPIEPGTLAQSEFAIARETMLHHIERSSQACVGADYARAKDILYQIITKFESSSDERVKLLLRDIKPIEPTEGQLELATRSENWVKWGQHYTLAYASHQISQTRLNFVDPGSLIYGGDDDSMFGLACKAAEEMYLTQTPPPPTGQATVAAAPTAPDPLLQTYIQTSYSAARTPAAGGGGGCFVANTQVQMANGSVKNIQDIQPGEVVYTPTGQAIVIAMVTLGYAEETMRLSRVGDCVLSPYHPYQKDGRWTCGADTVGVETFMCKTLYNLVLSNGHIIKVNDILACTLGHDLTDPGVAHPFFGSQMVIECLRKCPGWLAGYPVYKNLGCRREHGLVVEWFEQ